MFRFFVAVTLLVCLSIPENIYGLPPSVLSTSGDGGNLTGLLDNVFVYPNEDNPPAEPCSPTNTNSMEGVCLCQERCSASGGVGDSIGSCQQGICCAFRKQCSATQRSVEVVETVENLQSSSGFTGACKFVFLRQQGICQVRLDFVNLMLPDATSSGPTAGNCESDSLTVAGSANLDGPLKVCGVLTGQHMILSYGTASEEVSLTINSAPNYAIRATQIPCDSPNKAPDDCLQYHTSSTTPIKSFGFPRQLNNQKYTICVKPSSGGNILSWEACTYTDTFYPVTERFKVSGMGADCTTDWIVINDRRVCGQQFDPVQTSIGSHSKIHVHFDETESGNDIFYAEAPTSPPTSASCNSISIVPPVFYGSAPGVTPTPFLCNYPGNGQLCECAFSNVADNRAQALEIQVGYNFLYNYNCPVIPGYTLHNPTPVYCMNYGGSACCQYFANVRITDRGNTGFCLRYQTM